MSDVIEINRIEQLEPFRPLWRRLLMLTSDASFFQSLEWLESYWRWFGGDQRLRVLIVGTRDPIGIVPLTVIRERTRVGWVRTLTYPLHDWGTTFGPIGLFPDTALAAAMQHIRHTPRDWEMLDLRWISRDGGGLTATTRAMGAAGFDARCGIWHRTALVDMRGTWDEYFAGRSGKFRNNVRRLQRKVAQLGNTVYLRCRPLGEAEGDGDPRLHLYDACVDLARRSWQGSSTTGTTLSHAGVAGFLREVHVLAARAGAVDMNLLELDGRPVAFAYNYCWQGRVFGLRAGYDPAAADAGVGTVLFAHMLRDSFERGDERLDLGTGYFEGKRHWLTRVVDCCRVTHYPISEPRVQLLRMKHWLDRTLAGAVC